MRYCLITCVVAAIFCGTMTVVMYVRGDSAWPAIGMYALMVVACIGADRALGCLLDDQREARASKPLPVNKDSYWL